ncbi:MAG: hypothetical protein ABW277_23145 [Longimicrobiaceae bacterium]
MKKLKLDLEELSVESFATTPDARVDGGTVFGQQCTCYTQCTCPGCPTCDASCNGTCGGTCGATCNASCDGTCGCGTGDLSCVGTCVDLTCLNCDNATYGPGPLYYDHCVIYGYGTDL